MVHAIMMTGPISVTVQKAGKENIAMEVYTKYRSFLSHQIKQTRKKSTLIIHFYTFYNGLR